MSMASREGETTRDDERRCASLSSRVGVAALSALNSDEEDRGAVMAEYGLLIAVVFLALVSAVALFHEELVSIFGRTAEAVNTAGD